MRQTKRELLNVFGEQNVFDTPKPTALITRLINLMDAKDTNILEFFLRVGVYCACRDGKQCVR